MLKKLLGVLLLGTLTLSACSVPAAPHQTVQPSQPAPEISPTPDFPLEQALRDAFQIESPLQKHEEVLNVTGRFLRDISVTGVDDQTASTYFTNIAFSSGQITLSEPAHIQRFEDTAIIVFPEGLGIYLYDLSSSAPPLELARWVVGIDTIEINWIDNAVGVGYRTLGEDAITRVHYILAEYGSNGWYIAWNSDESPDWWFNAYNASLDIADDLSAITVTGDAFNTTNVFYELEDAPHRTFNLIWLRTPNGYSYYPPSESYHTRQEWLWVVAKPSAYATLVEFLERLQQDDREGATSLLRTPKTLEDAEDFGLFQPDRRFQIMSISDEQIAFRDLQAAFIASFQQPVQANEEWKIVEIKPFGVNHDENE